MEASSSTFFKLMYSFLLSMVIVTATALAIGKERKARWFRKRKKASFFTRRGVFGELWHFGYPCTKEGVLVSIVMFSLIAAGAYAIVYVF